MAESFEKRLGHPFKNPDLLKLALTHSSWGHEQNKRLPHNERLEFLGDSVLELVTSEYLFHTFTELPEGKLTKMRSHLVNRAALVVMAQTLKIGPELLMGSAEAMNGGRERVSNLANAMEAIIGAIFLDAGYETAKKFVIQHIEDRLKLLSDNPEPHNSKGLLQEKLHAMGDQATYSIISEKGPAHQKEFHASVEIRGKVYGTGMGKTKKDAETQAAWCALEKLAEEEKPVSK
jgi:ribonuclease-3